MALAICMMRRANWMASRRSPADDVEHLDRLDRGDRTIPKVRQQVLI
jgi:hypothetical protein